MRKSPPATGTKQTTTSEPACEKSKSNEAWVNEAADRLAVQLKMEPGAFRLRALALAVQIVDDNIAMDHAPFEVASPEIEFSATEALTGVPIADILKLEKGNRGNFAQRILYEMHETDQGRPGRVQSAWSTGDHGERQKLRKRERNRAAWLTDDQWSLQGAE